MDDKKQRAIEVLRQFKGDNYVFGLGRYERLGPLAASMGRRASVVIGGRNKAWAKPVFDATRAALSAAGLQLAGDFIASAAPNAPREDVFRIAESLKAQRPEVIVAVGGGSGIDAVKCAAAYWALGDRYPNLDDYFGVGEVTKMLQASGRAMPPVVAAQLAASSGAHLTKYSNITNVQTGQKMLIVDEAIVPPKSLFDYSMTVSMPRGFTMDGGLDGVSHCLEVYFGLPADKAAQARKACLLGIELVVTHLKTACEQPGNLDAREGLGLATDLGGYAIMVGGTNGAHLNSFSFTDILSHGRACALMNPYYAVFFAPAIESRIREVGAIYRAAGYTTADFDRLRGREAGLALAEAMIALSKSIGFPTTLREVQGFSEAHVQRALTAAKNPKLDSKLKNMPVPLSAAQVDEYMGPILDAATTGDFSRIRNMG